MTGELEAVIAAWQDAWFTGDASTIAATMADDYVYVGPNGAVMDRTAILEVVNDRPTRLRVEHTRNVLWSCSVTPRRWCATGGRGQGHSVGKPSLRTIDA